MNKDQLSLLRKYKRVKKIDFKSATKEDLINLVKCVNNGDITVDFNPKRSYFTTLTLPRGVEVNR